MTPRAAIIAPRSNRGPLDGALGGMTIPVGATVVLGAATVLAAIVSNGNLLAAIAPVAGAALFAGVWMAPLRVTLGIVMFLALAADRPGDTDGRWLSPLAPIGGLLFHNLNHIFSLDALKFSGVVALLAVLLVVRVGRCLTGRAQDTAGSLTMARPMRWALAVALATVVASLAFGVARGGDVEMAKIQVQAYLQLIAVAYLFGVSLRGERDYRWLGGLLVAAACVKAAMALWVRATLPASFPDQWGVMRELEYATNHGDSLLFTAATAMLLGPLFHRPTRRQVAWFLLLMPVVIAGVVANDRRVAWVEIGAVVAAFLLMNPVSTVTRRFLRVVVLALPLLVPYAIVGWSSASRVFGPVSFVRNIVQPERSDGSLDRSTLFRDVENYNLVDTFKGNTVLGTGFGFPFVETVAGDALPGFEEYYFLPHNSIVGLWAFTGIVGFSGLFLVIVIGMLLAARGHARARCPDHAIAGAAAFGCLVAYIVHLWADIGFTEAPTIFLIGLALAVAGQLAVATGEWQMPVTARPHSNQNQWEQP